MKYAAFITYSHRDERWARWVHRSVESYRIPARLKARFQTGSGQADNAGGPNSGRGRLRPVFRDREELASAASLSDKITEALQNSAALIVICSPAAASSRWVNQEILTFKRFHGEASVHCLIVDGEPGSTDGSECFPEALRFQLDETGAPGRQPAEPIAADLRSTGDGRTLARLKLIAGLLDVGLDELRQRDQQRRSRRLITITAASVVGMGLAAFLAVNAMLARDDARRRQQQAEDLIEFMLGDLKQELGKVGSLDALDAAAQKARDYFSELPAKDLNDTALARRAQAFRAIGEIHMDRLEWDQALSINQLALEAVRTLRERHPDDPSLLFDLAQSEFWIGYVHLESGQIDRAEAPLKAYLGLSRALLDDDPRNPDWVMEVSYGHSNLAALYDRQELSDLAVQHALLGIDFNRRATQLAPDVEFYREELAGAWTWLGVAQHGAGSLADAAISRAEARQLYQSMFTRDPANRALQERLAAAFRGEARALNLLGEHDVALATLQQGLAHFRDLCQIDPSNELWRWWRQGAELDRVAMLLDADLPERIGDTELAALAQLAETSYAGDADREARRLLAGMLHNQLCQSCESATDYQHSLQQLVMENPNRTLPLQSLAAGLLQQSQFAAAAGPLAAREITARLRELVARDNHPLNLSLLARVLMAEGKTEAASEPIQAVRKTGYRTTAFINECRANGLCADW